MTATNEAAGVQLLSLAPRAQRLRAELEALDPSLRALRESTNKLGDALGGILAPGMAQVGRAAIDMANDIASSRSAMGSLQAAGDVFGVTVTSVAGMIRGGLAKAIRDGNAANAELGSGIAAIEEKYKTFAGDSLASYRALLGAVQKFTREGGSSFSAIEKGMAALSIVQDIIALRAAVIAVLTQGEGEPYSAWARMAAMAAAVAPILASIGQTLSSFGGGGGAPSAQSAEVRQSQQGTGSVLGELTGEARRYGHEQLGYRRLCSCLDTLCAVDPNLGDLMTGLLSCAWKRDYRHQVATLGGIVRAMDRFSAARFMECASRRSACESDHHSFDDATWRVSAHP